MLSLSHIFSGVASLKGWQITDLCTIIGSYLNQPNGDVSNTIESRHGTASFISCDVGSTTYIIVEIYSRIAQRIMSATLQNSYDLILDHITIWGDGLLDNGVFHGMGPGGIGLEIRTMQGRQLTYKVLAAAISALITAMTTVGWGAASFNIYDSQDHRVGTGAVG